MKVASNAKDQEYLDQIIPEHLPVACNNFESSVVSAQGDIEPDKRLTSFNQIEVLVVDTSVICSIIEEQLHLFQETRLVVRIELGSELLLGSSSGG